ncbi:DUF3581 family protein [Candidatus Thiodiazotropha sp. CDECU1]|uniref:DUF3581 family protein n=1 Tax=Candidatus Thiodiazotropha sp. CDECU1 TaxID=3065865 RepID=UPI00293071A7|nr:DUF3581 family protein [Candidatus Thiodiazotropha sp. CDECU1]
MVLANYFTAEGNKVQFTRDQASRFAKEIANDFNPLHNTEAKMFCVPGDLLFAVALNHLGLSQQMHFTFSGMVRDQAVIFPDSSASLIQVVDEAGKQYLSIEREGETTHDPLLIDHLSSRYVAFSGMAFPHILVPLMAAEGVMINPARPLVIYQSMEIDLNRLDLNDPQLESTGSSLDVQGKKGMVRLDFRFMEAGIEVGHGTKHMALRGLQPYQDEVMQGVVDEYNDYKQTYITAGKG